MFGAAIIVFRETLEAALLLGIIAAATRGVPGRERWLWGGVGLGLLGAVGVALFTESIGAMANGIGQELFNAIILSTAILMLGWHTIWASTHGAEMAANAKHLGRAVQHGEQNLSAVLVAVGLAVLREGSETVLFMYGYANSGEQGAHWMLLGGGMGLAAGAAAGYVLYTGLARIPLRWFFTVTNTLVLLLAAAMASQLARVLNQADLLPSLGSPLWDTAWLLTNDSPFGAVLHAMVGYDARPAGIQVVFYALTCITFIVGAKLAGKSKPAPQKAIA